MDVKEIVDCSLPVILNVIYDWQNKFQHFVGFNEIVDIGGEIDELVKTTAFRDRLDMVFFENNSLHL